jgi:Uma2 family endonuclease
MTAEPVPEYVPEPEPQPRLETARVSEHEEPNAVPGWLMPPQDGFKAEDLDRIPQLPAHTELIDGSLVFVSPQRRFHWLVIHTLVAGLFRAVPENLGVEQEMTVTLAERQRPEPDVMVVRAEAIKGLEQTNFQAEDVVLAVEVVSPESEIRDRERKPQLYAEAGIPHFWRVELSGASPMVCVYELDPATKQYDLTGTYHNRLKLTVPFEIDIDLTEITRL